MNNFVYNRLRGHVSPKMSRGSGVNIFLWPTPCYKSNFYSWNCDNMLICYYLYVCVCVCVCQTVHVLVCNITVNEIGGY